MRLAFPAPLLARGGRARLPLRRGQPDLGRHDREHAGRRVLLHLRRRLRVAVPRRAACAARMDGRSPWLPGARCSRSRPTPTATRCCGRGSPPPGSCSADPGGRRASTALRPDSAQPHAAARGLAGGRGARRVRARRARAAAARRGLGLDDALRRRLDRPDARAASFRRCCGRSSRPRPWGSPGASRAAARSEALDPRLCAARVRRARGRGARAARARASA